MSRLKRHPDCTTGTPQFVLLLFGFVISVCFWISCRLQLTWVLSVFLPVCLLILAALGHGIFFYLFSYSLAHTVLSFMFSPRTPPPGPVSFHGLSFQRPHSLKCLNHFPSELSLGPGQEWQCRAWIWNLCIYSLQAFHLSTVHKLNLKSLWKENTSRLRCGRVQGLGFFDIMLVARHRFRSHPNEGVLMSFKREKHIWISGLSQLEWKIASLQEKSKNLRLFCSNYQ